MDSKGDTKGNMDPKQANVIKMPRTRRVPKRLDNDGVAHVIGENPQFEGTPYCVYLGLRVDKFGPQIRYGTQRLPKEGDYFYVEVQESGSFDIHLKALSFRNEDVTIVWWAIPEGPTPIIGPTIGPTPTPAPTPRPTISPAIGPTIGPTPTPAPTPTPTISPAIGPTIGRFDPVDFPGRYVNEVPGIGPEYIRRLAKGGIGSLAALASAVATDVARILSISEVRAMSFIDEARRLLQGRSGNDQAGG